MKTCDSLHTGETDSILRGVIHGLLGPVPDGTILLGEGSRRRKLWQPHAGTEMLVDTLQGGRVEIRFLRVASSGGNSEPQVRFTFDEMHDLGGEWGFGGIFHDTDVTRTAWIPRPPRLIRSRDKAGRIDVLSTKSDGWFLKEGPTLSIEFPQTRTGAYWSLPLVILEDPGRLRFDQLVHNSRMRWPRLVKADWFLADSPAQVWDALVDGDVYDPRPSVVGRGRFRCQQCASAWWSYLNVTSHVGQFDLLSVLATEIAWSVRNQLDEPGAWRHGFWYEEPETHLRFFNDGIGLLLGEAEISGDRLWAESAEKATEQLIRNYSDELDGGGLWFLHDSLEANGAPPPNPAPDLGQASSNTLCLNTHVQALTMLIRLSMQQDAPSCIHTMKVYRRGLKALRFVLKLDSAPVAYRWLGAFVRPAVESKGRNGLCARVTRVFAFRILPRFYWWMRRQFPRIAYPNGFLERDMTSSMMADDYHVLNLKELLILYAHDPQPWLESVIEKAYCFQASLDIEKAIARSLLFSETVDVDFLYRRLVGNRICNGFEIDASLAEEILGAGSLDAKAMESLGLLPGIPAPER